MGGRSEGPLRVVLAAVLAALLAAGLMTALNSDIAGHATAAPADPTMMLHDCVTSATTGNRTLPVSSAA